MSCFRFLSDNWADSEIYANLLESSEQTNFPATNILAKKRRSKVWRSNGYYNIVTGENDIVFRDASGGADKTALVAVGEYTSTAAFMAAVDAAFEAAGVANYTITQNSAYKFVITSDLSGGATAFELRWADCTEMAAILGFDSSANDTGASTYTADYLRINSEEWITFDLGLPSSPNGFALCGLRNKPLKLSTTGTFKLQGSVTNSWTSPAYSQTLTYDDEVLAVFSTTTFHNVPLRYWRISFSDQNTNGYLEVGSVFLGEYYTTTRGIPTFPFQSNLDDRTKLISSEGGQVFADIQEKTQKFTVKYAAITKTELEDLLEIWDKYGKHSPFFISFDSDAAYSSSLNRMLKYVRFDSEPSYTLESPNNFTMNMTFKEDL